MNLREIRLIVLHCSASRVTERYTFEQVRYDHMHKDPPWTDIGYHYYIELDGAIHKGRPLWRIGAHVRGHNGNSVGICYEGGLNAAGIPADTRTELQRAAILDCIKEVLELLRADGQDTSSIRILGHRDLSPDLNGDGTIQASERIKECPCFDAIPEYKWITA